MLSLAFLKDLPKTDNAEAKAELKSMPKFLDMLKFVALPHSSSDFEAQKRAARTRKFPAGDKKDRSKLKLFNAQIVYQITLRLGTFQRGLFALLVGGFEHKLFAVLSDLWEQAHPNQPKVAVLLGFLRRSEVIQESAQFPPAPAPDSGIKTKAMTQERARELFVEQLDAVAASDAGQPMITKASALYVNTFLAKRPPQQHAPAHGSPYGFPPQAPIQNFPPFMYPHNLPYSYTTRPSALTLRVQLVP